MEQHSAGTNGVGQSLAAVLGPAGTFSHFTALDFFSGIFDSPGQAPEVLLCDTVDDVFESITSGRVWFGLVPLENSLYGPYGATYDLLRTHPVCIRAELLARLRHALLSQVNTLAEVQRVYSHPTALSHTMNWLRRNLPGVPLIGMESTAAAARRATAEEGAAAVGHWRLSPITGLYVLAEDLDSGADNWTRWVVLTLHNAPPLPPVTMAASRPLRTMIQVDMLNQPGTLVQFLSPLAQAGVSVLRLEQRPIPGSWWEDEHFMVLDCDLNAPELAPLLETLHKACVHLRVLGVYHEGPRLQTS